MCAFLKPTANIFQSAAEAPDNNQETCWQFTWVRDEEPTAGTSIRTKNGKRFCFPVTGRDCTFARTLYIQESGALALSGLADADQFGTAFEAGKVWLPKLASVRILRALISSSAAQPAEQKKDSGVDQHVD